MNVASRKVMTLAEFLDWEDRQELRHEFDGTRPAAMTGGTANHAFIQRNLSTALDSRLLGKPCQFVGSDLKFLTAEGTSRYPDGMVVCVPMDGQAKFVESPTIVFEALSPGAADVDRIDKAREYEATPSVQRYVMLEQSRVVAVVYARIAGAWTHSILRNGDTLALPEIGVEFPLVDLYRGISFPDPESGSG